MRQNGEAILLCDARGGVVGRLSRRAAGEWLPRLTAVESARAVALLRRRCDDGDGDYRDRCRCESWEYPLVELIWRRPGASPSGPDG